MVWEMLCKRTEDPKLRWLESKLTEAGVAHRRNGHSFHAPILEVDAEKLDLAWAILSPVDDLPDDEPFWTDDPDGCSCDADSLCAFCLVKEAIEEAKT